MNAETMRNIYELLPKVNKACDHKPNGPPGTMCGCAAITKLVKHLSIDNQYLYPAPPQSLHGGKK